MRLRKVANAKQIIESSKYVIGSPKDFKGKYKTLFKNENEIHLEIGMGKGDFIIEMAKHNKNINFIGIEMYDSVLVRAVQKLENQALDNLKLIRFDATYIEDVFDREIDKIYLNFSDPWPKNRCEKRRLTSKLFLERYDKIFRERCNITQKTDNRKLFEFSLISYVENNYTIKDISLNLHEDKKDNIMSEYEKRFVKMNLPIYMVEVYKTLHVK